MASKIKLPKSGTLPDKDFYTTHDLVHQDWFPISSSITLNKLIEAGKIQAVDISTTKYKRYRIPKQAAVDFIHANQNVSRRTAKALAKQGRKAIGKVTNIRLTKDGKVVGNVKYTKEGKKIIKQLKKK